MKLQKVGIACPFWYNLHIDASVECTRDVLHKADERFLIISFPLTPSTPPTCDQSVFVITSSFFITIVTGCNWHAVTYSVFNAIVAEQQKRVASNSAA